MARNAAAAARLLAYSPSPFPSSHHHHHRRALPVPTSRSKTSSSKPALPSPRTDTTNNPAAATGPRPSLFQEISGLITPAAGTVSDPPFQSRVNKQSEWSGNEAPVQCTEGARPNAPETFAFFVGRIPDQGVPDGPSDSPDGNAKGSAPSREASSYEVVGDVLAQDSDIDSAHVQKITEVLRSEVPGSPFEERLGSLGVVYTPRIANMVLKRCFKKAHLGLRFHYWVKQVPGFHHTTETYNTMLFIAGEARSFGFMEELMGEMDKEMCPKDIKTWTIMIASYGKARQIGKMLSAFHAMKKSGSVAVDTKVYRAILRALCFNARHELALEFYKDMPTNMDVGYDILRLLLCLLAGSNNAEAVFIIRDDMIKSARYPEEYCYLEALRSFCVSGKIAEAQKVFQQMMNKSMEELICF